MRSAAARSVTERKGKMGAPGPPMETYGEVIVPTTPGFVQPT